MAMDPQRAAALKAAKWLVTKGRGDEAVALLASWAASGANDEDGQELMAEALRVNPGAPIVAHPECTKAVRMLRSASFLKKAHKKTLPLSFLRTNSFLSTISLQESLLKSC